MDVGGAASTALPRRLRARGVWMINNNNNASHLYCAQKCKTNS